MYTSGLVPPRLALFGLVGGPLIIVSGALVIVDVIEAGGAVQALCTVPEFIWELGIGIYLIVKGYRMSSPALAGTQEAPPV
jgi:gamma-glutamyltranspeptidase